MFGNIGRSVVLVGSAAGVTLCLAGGVAVGVVPQAGAPPTSPGQPAQQVAAAAAPPASVAPPVTAPPATAPPALAPPTTGARATAPRRTVTTEAPTSGAAAAPAAAAPAGPYIAPRLNPSSAALQSAMNSMKARNPVYGGLTEAQAREFGNQVCGAFDAGQSSAQVQAAALQQAAKAPFPVSAADVRFAVSSAVGLFCPGYLSRV
jgi:hypothetical protein